MLNYKITIFTAALALGAAILATDASAFSLGGYTGPVRFIYSNFDAATTGYPTLTPPGTVCDSVSTCDSAAAAPAPHAIGSEDTWGVYQISQIEDPVGNVLWSSGTNGEYLHGMFYGLADRRVDYLGTAPGAAGDNVWQAYDINGSLDLYLSNSGCSAGNGPAGRTGSSTYGCYTTGTLALSAVFNPTANGAVHDSTYSSKFDSATVQGSGVGYLDITGGSLQSLFDTSSVPDVGSPTAFHDFELDTTFSCNPTDAACNTLLSNWTVTSTGQVKNAFPTPMPEPGILFMMGAGLLALIGIRRRKSRSA